MKWEFLMSVSHKLTPSTNTSDINATMASINAWNQTGTTVAVHTMRDSWSYRDASDAKISEEDRRRLGMPSAFESIEGMRQGLRSDLARSEDGNEPREFQVAESAEEVPSGNIPVQNMLTCFYSTNDKYCVNNVDLLSRERVERLRGISCIAVQGGSDRICPPDTALDLLEAWPEMELRVPISAGHSMYDASIKNELVRATDRFADKFY
jgi:hypothetical protein